MFPHDINVVRFTGLLRRRQTACPTLALLRFHMILILTSNHRIAETFFRVSAATGNVPIPRNSLLSRVYDSAFQMSMGKYPTEIYSKDTFWFEHAELLIQQLVLCPNHKTDK